MKRAVLVAGLVAFGAVAAGAQNVNVIEQRQNLMKQNSQVTKGPAGMLREQGSFNLQQVQAALKTLSENAKKIPALFPADSKTGGDTKALPAIWENKAGFDEIAVKMDTQALASSTDEASFKAQFPKVLENCGTCHKTFRKS
jgi:cytochrome c556